MKKPLFLMLVLYVAHMQLAVAGANGETDEKQQAEQVGQVADAGLNAMERSWSPEDRDSPDLRTKELDDGYTEFTQVEKRTSSGSTPFEEVISSGKSCMSAKCNPSKDTEKDSGENKKSTGTNDQGSDANDQAVQQITNNNNNMANKLANDGANTVVVPPVDPCLMNPAQCGPQDPCLMNPAQCGPQDPCLMNPAQCGPGPLPPI